MEILNHVWELGEATVADVRGRMLGKRRVAYTTVMTIMKNLTEKGYLAYEKRGAAYVYSPARPAEEVRRSIVGDLVQKVFKGSPLALVQTLVRREDLTDEQRRKLITFIQGLEDDHGPHT
jgi:predicted transcriptional regulator